MSTTNRLAAWSTKHSTLPLLLVPLVIVGVLVNFFASQLVADIFTFFCVSLMMVFSVQIFMGNSGILSWTHVGFVGIGAYASGILSTSPSVKDMGVPNMFPALVQLQIPVLPAILVGGLVAAAVAFVIGYPLMRLSDFAGVITLFATLIVIHVVLTQWDNVTNGPRTLFGVPNWTTLTAAMIGAIAVVGLAYWFRESALGLKLRATRDDRYAAAAIGINMVFVRYLTFVLSAGVAGVAGGFWAHYITSFSPKAFYMSEMFLLLSMLVIGGAGSISGAFTGTVVVTIAREMLRQVEANINNAHVLPFDVFGLTEIVMAVLMVLVLIWRPGGIVGGQELRWPDFRRTGKKDRQAGESAASA
jgi:branched-chain amino acid transport system permease protein